MNIDNSWVAVCKIECDKISRELSEKYEHELKIQLDKKIYTEKELEEMGKSVSIILDKSYSIRLGQRF